MVIKASPASGWKLWRWSGVCHGSAASCSLRVKTHPFVTASFVPPGDRLNPYPLGTAGGAPGSAWLMRVLSARAEGSDLIVQIAATNNNPGSYTWTFGLAYWIFAYEESGAEDGIDQCTPPAPDFLTGVGSWVDPYGPGAVAYGATVIGNLCFKFFHAPKKLLVEPAWEYPPPEVQDGTPVEPTSPIPFEAVWFGLR